LACLPALKEMNSHSSTLPAAPGLSVSGREKTYILDRVKRALRRMRRRLFDLRAYVPGLRFLHLNEKMIGPVGYWNELQRYQFNVLRINGLKPWHALLDLGCGPLQGGIAFIRYLDESRYTGVDIKLKPVQAAYEQVVRNGLAGKNPRFICSRTFGDDHLGESTFDFIWVSQLLYLFDENNLSELLSMARRRLSPGGKLLGDIIHPDRYESIVYPGCGYLRYTVEQVQRLAEAAGMRARSLGQIMHYRYPSRLTHRTNLMLEFTRMP
jgi:SAM-dependent methyltransferase